MQTRFEKAEIPRIGSNSDIFIWQSIYCGKHVGLGDYWCWHIAVSNFRALLLTVKWKNEKQKWKNEKIIKSFQNDSEVRVNSFLSRRVSARVLTSATSGLPRGKCSCWPCVHTRASAARWAPARTRSTASRTARSGRLRWSPSRPSGRSWALACDSTCRPSGLLGAAKDKVQEYEGKQGIKEI